MINGSPSESAGPDLKNNYYKKFFGKVFATDHFIFLFLGHNTLVIR